MSEKLYKGCETRKLIKSRAFEEYISQKLVI